MLVQVTVRQTHLRLLWVVVEYTQDERYIHVHVCMMSAGTGTVHCICTHNSATKSSHAVTLILHHVNVQCICNMYMYIPSVCADG